MTIFDRRPRLRWAVPTAAVALIAAGALVGGSGASADAGLAPKSAEELLVDLQAPQTDSLSGTVQVTADLGLPALPAGMGGSATGPSTLVSGTHTLRVWADGPTRSRVALLGDAAEYGVIRNGKDVWIWSSAEETAEHLTLADKDRSAAAGQLPANAPSTPQEAAQLILSALDPTTEVSTSGVGEVAGRPVYELILTPTQDGTLVDRVVVAMDAETQVPLRVQAFSTQMAEPAYEVAFTSVEFGTPDASLFAFTPPPGVTVTDHALPDMGEASAAAPPARDRTTEPTVVGAGWTQVVVGAIPAEATDTDDASGSPSADVMALLQTLPRTTGSWGSGSVLAGTLFSVILTDDGRFAVGAVNPEVLGAALASG